MNEADWESKGRRLGRESKRRPKTVAPPLEWWTPLHAEAVQRGLKIYHKDNLFDPERGFPHDGKERVTQVPKVFKYLKGMAQRDVNLGETA